MRRLVFALFLLFAPWVPAAGAAALQQDCSGVSITSPKANDAVRGRVDISGSANIPQFQFYKVEYAPTSNPSDSSFANVGPDVRRTAVQSGLLDVWDTSSLPDGPYTVRLTVVDIRGNFPCPPVQVRPIVVSNRAATRTPTATPTEAITPTATINIVVTRLPAPTVVLPTSAARATPTRAATAAPDSRPLINLDFLPGLMEALSWGICAMAALVVISLVYISVRAILNRL
ncbi:MAG: hypothetical protein HZB53_13590 [Chloroflexi bacterium]|nr:hypothetical protein [Chloroflexota bacterium]